MDSKFDNECIHKNLQLLLLSGEEIGKGWAKFLIKWCNCLQVEHLPVFKDCFSAIYVCIPEGGTVDGSEIRLNQLRLVVYPRWFSRRISEPSTISLTHKDAVKY